MISAPKICGRSHIRAGLSGYVAELGAAFTVGHLGLTAKPREDHALYIASWLQVLRDDPAAILTAANRAQLAADYLISLADVGRQRQPDACLAPAQPELAA
ncbi:hypothetical protein L288_20405 [Sphingobium quisquiliarum P25]|uniref:Polyvalent protein metallopeptidase domain-containing protein n=1 Tax=Sphingobium quisquiliarum P25 TaxID=1329909 RepID=T0GD65_9SPHN|nr:zincin-like metallopeptidase domain-containing protein [Sphingobium quisquiliarum]EQA98616.1 hypothetical protein L288_20405 [Sphingobium quisquiliarum P25]